MGDYGQQSTATAVKESRESISTVIGEIGEQLDSLAKVFSHLDAIGDALDGTRPQEVAGNDPEPPVSSIIDNLRRKRRTLNNLVGRCQEAAARIENAIR